MVAPRGAVLVPRVVLVHVVVLVVFVVLLASGCGGTKPQRADAGAAPEAGPAGYALSFDGAKQYATAGEAGFAPVGAAQTIEMWVRYRSAGTDQDLLVLRTDFASGVRVGLHAGTLAVRRVYVDRVLVQAPVLPSVGDWHHVAYTFDLTAHTLYVDGAAVDTQSIGGDTRTPTSAWLGSIDGSNALFGGDLDEVRVWTIARSPAEVQADMLHRPAAAEEGLVAYWTFDDVTSGRALDQSGSGNDVTLGDGIAARMPARVPSDAPAGS